MGHYPENPLAELREIRALMERSSRFIGLSGLSGIGAGLFALAGAAMAYAYTEAGGLRPWKVYLLEPAGLHPWGMSPLVFFLLDALFVLAGALSCGIYFTMRRAWQKSQPTWDALTRRLLINLALPLAAGGIFCLGLVYHGLPWLVSSTTLVFYGLALINGSKYTLSDVRYLGVAEVALGLFALFFPGRGLLMWTIGFGVLHVVYGTLMYWKYERGIQDSLGKMVH